MKLKYLKFESSHYIFHYYKNSWAEKELEKVVSTQEESYNMIIDFFKIEVPFKINYYLLNSPKEIGIAYGDNEDSNGFARKPNHIYAVYNKDIKCVGSHEDAHIISYLLNTPKSCFVREGIAMFFDKNWWKKPNIDWVLEFVEKGKYERVIDLIADDYFYTINCAISYPIAGAFTKYLIDIYGVEKYLNFYKSHEDIKEAIKMIYNKQLKELENDFLANINNFSKKF